MDTLLNGISKAIEFLISIFTGFLEVIGIQISVKTLSIILIIVLIAILAILIAKKIIKKRRYIRK